VDKAEADPKVGPTETVVVVTAEIEAVVDNPVDKDRKAAAAEKIETTSINPGIATVVGVTESLLRIKYLSNMITYSSNT
jgi:hypothetical protein